MHAEFSTSTKTWATSSDRVTENHWHAVQLSWNERKGLEMYLDRELAASSTTPTLHPSQTQTDHAVYVGRATDDVSDGQYADAIVDELEFWYADRDQLIVLGLLDQGI